MAKTKSKATISEVFGIIDNVVVTNIVPGNTAKFTQDTDPQKELTGKIVITDAATGKVVDIRKFDPKNPNSRAESVLKPKAKKKPRATITAL